jgi:hypothetical protein
MDRAKPTTHGGVHPHHFLPPGGPFLINIFFLNYLEMPDVLLPNNQLVASPPIWNPTIELQADFRP